MSIEDSRELEDVARVDTETHRRPVQDSKSSPDYHAHLIADHETYDSRSRNTHFLSKDGWLVEILSLVLAALVLVSVIALLARFDRQPNPSWWSGITLNTILSFASMVFRACIFVPLANCISQLCWTWCSEQQRPLHHILLFDQASRGLFGGLQALHAGIWSMLSIFGISATLLAVVVGPFFQQSIASYSDSVIDHSISAYVSTARTYNGSLDPSAGGTSRQAGSYTYNMRSAMYYGLLSSGMFDRPNAPYSCPTGNCTWDPFSTLAIGVQCMDLGKYYTLNCSNDGNSPQDSCRIDTTFGQNTSSAWPFISKPDFTIGKADYGIAAMTVMFLGTSYTTSFDDLPQNTWAIKPTGGLARVSWARATGSLNPSQSPIYAPFIHKNSTFDSGMCIFYSEMQDISAKVENGIYTETVLQEVTRADNADLVEQHWSSRAMEVSAPPIEYSFKPSCNSTDSPEQCNKALQNISLATTVNYYLLSGMDMIFSENSRQNVTANNDEGLGGSQILKTMYLSPNISSCLENMARYMTVALRSNDTTLALQNDPNNATGYPLDYVAPSHRVSGYAHRDQIHIRVRWAWLSLPAILVVLVTILLIGTIQAIREQHVGIWKHNPLALLLHTDWRPHPSTSMQGSTSADMGRATDGLKARVVGNRVWIGPKDDQTD